jgi:hypothetical protein
MAVSGQTVAVGNLTSVVTLPPNRIATLWSQGVSFRPGTFFRLAPQLDAANSKGAAIEIADTNDGAGRGGEVVWRNDDGTQTPAITVINRSNENVSFVINYLIAPG